MRPSRAALVIAALLTLLLAAACGPKPAPTQAIQPPPDTGGSPSQGASPGTAPVVTMPSIDINGTWNGTFLDLAGNVMRVATLTIVHAPGQANFTGSIAFNTLDNNFPEAFPITGVVDGDSIRFNEAQGRHFWGVFKGDTYYGYAAWDCYFCTEVAWAEMNLVRGVAAETVTLVAQGSSAAPGGGNAPPAPPEPPAATVAGSGTIFGQILQDTNGNGLLDTGEPGWSADPVALRDATCGTTYATTLPISDGSFYFSGLLPGEYCVVIMTAQPLGACPGRERPATVPSGGLAEVFFCVTPGGAPSGSISLECPANIGRTEGDPPVVYTLIVNGGCGGHTITCSPPSGTDFGIGAEPVTCTAVDACGATATCGFSVTTVMAAPPPVSTGQISISMFRLVSCSGNDRSPLGGVTINLYQGGMLIASGASDSSGFAGFQNLPAGEYTIEYVGVTNCGGFSSNEATVTGGNELYVIFEAAP